MRAIYTFLVLVVIITCSAAGSFAQNYKIKQSTSLSGQTFESTVYVKGSRKRTENGGMMGFGGDIADIEQCDLKRMVKVNDKKRLYFIEPFAGGEASEVVTPATRTPVTTGKVTKGGVVTMTSSIVDTGERKQMFGLTARRIKTVMTVESSPDACSKQNTRIETDGWYVDLPQFSCPVNVSRNPIPQTQQPRSGCQDRMVAKQSGTGKLGFPLQLSQTMNSGEGGPSFTQTIETIEFSKATLDDALFEVPANYTLANSSQDLYGRPDFVAMIGGNQNSDEYNRKSAPPKTYPPTTPAVKRPGVKRIGVLAPTNRSGESVSITNLQNYLVEKLTVGNVEGFAVGSEAEARAADCDYILSSDFSKLKQSTSSKIGGLFGKVTNTDTSASLNYEAQVEFKLVKVAGGGSVLQTKASNKTAGNVDRAAEAVLAIEAAAVLSAAK